MNIKKKILIVMHTGLFGGAGIYNQYLVTNLSELGHEIVASGDLRAYDFNEKVDRNRHCGSFNKLKFANYLGVNPLRKVHLLISGLFPFIKAYSNLKKENFDYDSVIFTSSIQIIEAFFLKLRYPNIKSVVIIQENLILTGLLGAVARYMLRRIKVISITNSWRDYAKNFGVSSVPLYNPVILRECTKNIVTSNNDEAEWDVLYVGGDSKIKGFQTLRKLLLSVPMTQEMSFCLLGRYSQESINEIREISALKPNLQIDIFGLVDNIAPYLIQSKILVLLITAPHFCRPAVEAGMLKKTFIINDLPGMGEFCTVGNCIRFERNNVRSLYNELCRILDNEIDTSELGLANYNFVSEKFSHDQFAHKIHKFLKESFF